MLHKKAFIKKTRKGKIQQIVREHYLRDDIYSGTPWDPECDAGAAKLSKDAKHYLVADTNVVLSQMDFLEHAAVEDVIIMSVVLDEVRHRNQSVYQRLRSLCASPTRRFYVFANEHHRDTYIKQEPGESVNDRNDRAIRVATKWYMSRLEPASQADQVPEIILLTNDAENRSRAQSEGLTAISIQAYAKSRTECPELMDLVAAGNLEDEAETAASRAKHAKRARIYEDHRGMADITAGLKAGKYHQGTLRVSRYNPFEGWVGSESVGEDILISGRVAMNRAIEGDAVAIELLPEAEWRAASATLPKAGADGAPAEDAEGAEDMQEDGGHIMEVVPMDISEQPPELTAASKRPTGKVVGIIRRNWRTRGYCGSLQPQQRASARGSTASVLFCPVERRFPMIRLQTRQAEALADKRIVVVIDSWEADSHYPAGHYVRTLGTIGDRDTETEVLLIEHDINTSPFTPAVHACVPQLPWSVTPADLDDPNRQDLRHLPICSVDPPGCKDIDDALHVVELPNGNLELGVHIADVTHFLKPATAIDDEAASRATTTYLVQRRIDMLPKPLTEDICSLRADVERLAFSVVWEMTQSADVVSVRFTKSVIKSRAALTYAEAQSRIDDERLHDEISNSLRTMNRVARILRKRRADAGALSLASPEVKFEIDTETHDPLDVGIYQIREANQMVEEMMLLANVTVAEHTLRAFPACALLRRHPVPAPRQFDPLLRAAAAAGFSLDCSTSKMLAESLDKAVRADDAYFNKLVRIMATRCMTQAVYFGSGECDPPEYHHYGLAAPLYTHFTSPIRRYADVVVHRVLAASLGLAPLPETARDRDGVRSLTDNLNTRHHNAQMAGRASVELHTLIFFKDRVVVADARITKVRSNGLIIFVPKYGIEGPVYFTPKDAAASAKGGARAAIPKQPVSAAAAGSAPPESEYILDEEKQTVTSPDGKVCYTIFDKAAVRIAVEETHGQRRHLVLTLVDRNELPESEQMG
ncbi:hypothetical protein WJX72_005833 [[Myrmecia] bisecta]|uniref:Exosome complex exonuclease RRP44 n=1 Tax=[Myrmecia] bisecta TaxID=41462 RepID=A0AAW1QRH2_9CHLO